MVLLRLLKKEESYNYYYVRSGMFYTRRKTLHFIPQLNQASMIPGTDPDSLDRHVTCRRTANKIRAHSTTSFPFLLSLSLLFLLFSSASAASLTLTFDLLEESPPPTLVSILSNETKIRGLFRYPPSVPSSSRYSFLSQDRTGHQRLFRLSEHDGRLTTAESIDREELCQPEPDVTSCEMELDVAIQRGALLHTVRVVVRLVDRNDHSPKFVKDEVQLTISETDGPGTEFSLPEVDDPDSGIFGTIDFQLVVDDPRRTNGTFRIRTQRNIDGTRELRLVLERNLDREEAERYRMRVLARDGGNPVRTGTLLVHIVVLDVNDNPPRFVEPTFDVSIAENLPNGTIIGVVKAVDRDEGSNGAVTFAFARSTQQTVTGLFSVGRESGEIRVVGPVDFERRRRYSLGIVASDHGPNPLSSHAVVTVHVTDVNDNPPRISVSPLTQSGQPEVKENAGVGTFAAHVSVTDPDLGEGGEWNCSLSGHPGFRLERIPEVNQNEFKLVTSAVFDREVAQLYHVTLTCADRGHPALTGSTEVAVRILDENDEAPQFRLPVYSASVVENNRIGEFLGEVTAFDRDLGKNGVISYAISGGEISGILPVTIDAKLGRIYSNAVFDREERASYEFRVIASDAGLPVRSAAINFRLEVTDVNDEVPTFFHRMFTFGTYENQPSGTEIGTVTAVDRDGPAHSVIHYEIVGSSVDTFRIDVSTGKITALKSLDRETVPLYLLNVTARNPDVTSVQRGETQVKIIVADRNDNTPRIRFPAATNSSVQISSRARIGDVIAAVDAVDDDVGSNAALRYVINGSDVVVTSELFAVNLLTGVVTVRRDLLNHADQSFPVSLIVHDEGQPRRSAAAFLLITVNSSLDAFASSSWGQRGPIPFSTLTIVISAVGASCFLIVISVIMFLVLRHRRRRPEVVISQRPEVDKMLPVTDSRGLVMRNENHPSVKSNLLQYDADSKLLRNEKTIDNKNKKNSNKNKKNWTKNKRNVSKSEDELRGKQIAWLASYEDNLLQTYKDKNNKLTSSPSSPTTSPSPSNRMPPPPPPPPAPPSGSSLPPGYWRRGDEDRTGKRFGEEERGTCRPQQVSYSTTDALHPIPASCGCCDRQHVRPTPASQSPGGGCLVTPLTDRSSDQGSVTDSGRGQSDDGCDHVTSQTRTMRQVRHFPHPKDNQLVPYAISPLGQSVGWTTRPTCITAECRCDHASHQRLIWNRATPDQHRLISNRAPTDVTVPMQGSRLSTGSNMAATSPTGNTFNGNTVHGKSTLTGTVGTSTGNVGHVTRNGRREEATEEDGYISDDATTTSGSYVLENKDGNVWREQRHPGSSEASRV